MSPFGIEKYKRRKIERKNGKKENDEEIKKIRLKLNKLIIYLFKLISFASPKN